MEIKFSKDYYKYKWHCFWAMWYEAKGYYYGTEKYTSKITRHEEKASKALMGHQNNIPEEPVNNEEIPYNSDSVNKNKSLETAASSD
ncbi:hypothetical protein [Salipaludibacillus aurantiacus]|uniref:Uncharacterized protein n=1 Tax=Salipaludibacillus aurantiacus TaxID=1601833 RepID=A0A1H9RUS0_9BACI|nr:hypothetical protein [Salipaludibacillus aurantiacus]SER76397.1 hypothetical protein SAMN05518684_103345 [Salipaludibacillus aurantiacus]